MSLQNSYYVRVIYPFRLALLSYSKLTITHSEFRMVMH